MTAPCPHKTATDLEWARVLGAFAERCVSVMGRDLVRGLPFSATLEEARTVLDEGREATLLAREGEALPVASFPDVREAIERLRVAGVLSASELRDVASALAAARTLRRFLVARRARVPALFTSCATDPTLDAACDEVSSAFDADGTLADHASPRLKELRGEVRQTRARVLSRLDDLMSRYDAILQDRFVTEREGRFVVPVRSDSHERFPGIVHSASASGATLFVEPRAIIPMGNRLKVLEGDVEREELVVYTRLSSRLMEALPSLQGACDALCRADARAAVAKLAVGNHLEFPTLVAEPRLELRAARHLLLLLELHAVVPSDLSIEKGRAMIVSGPNAGGKTVALKTMGLAALSARAGLPISCAEGSVVGWFDVVLSDVGDDQSLHKNLSTFSAHVRNLTAILEDTHEGALVLLDEVATGTDPREGEALAAGVLDSLCRRGGAVVTTTHYEGLKALAVSDPRFSNASVGFDLATMTPTFELTMGVPGRSSALAVARQYGMPALVVERAEKFLSPKDATFEDTVRRLDEERAALGLARGALEAEREQVARLRAELAEEHERAKDREQRQVSKETEALLVAVQRAREELRAVQARLRSKRTDETELRQVARSLDKVAATVAVGGELEPRASAGRLAPRAAIGARTLQKGARVWVAQLRSEAEVVGVEPDGVRVAAGALKLVVPYAELYAPDPEPPRAPGAEKGARSKGRGDDTRPARSESLEVPFQTTSNTCDLRGLRVDDGLSMMTAFLDRAMGHGERVAFVIHGHGTGAMRDAVRAELASSPYVRSSRPGDRHEGGDGVTVVWVR
jgi:DNA mismatch repair protein MutS2